MVEIYCDAASVQDMERFAGDPRIAGFTTNPTLMKASGITDYKQFARGVLAIVGWKPISFEVLADDFKTMEKQAREIGSWGQNVYVKIPITDTRGRCCTKILGALEGLNVNVTAVMTQNQIDEVQWYLEEHEIISVFAGRIADTRAEPLRPACESGAKLLWASARQVYDVVRARKLGYDIITLTPALIAKLHLLNKDLTEYSLETVKQFHEDGKGIEF